MKYCTVSDPGTDTRTHRHKIPQHTHWADGRIPSCSSAFLVHTGSTPGGAPQDHGPIPAEPDLARSRMLSWRARHLSNRITVEHAARCRHFQGNPALRRMDPPPHHPPTMRANGAGISIKTERVGAGGERSSQQKFPPRPPP